MAQKKASILFRRSLRKLFPNTVLRGWARETGALCRRRKVDPVELFWVLTLGFGLGRDRTLAGLRRSYEKATGKTLAPSSFYKRFTPGLTEMMRLAVVRALEVGTGTERALSGPLANFRDILITDGTVIRLHKLLASRFPATRTNVTEAAAKMHVLMSVARAGKGTVKITSERASEGRMLRIGPWVEGKLLMFDLGYFCYRLFSRIDRNAGFYLSRLKANANPRIVALNRKVRGNSVPLVGWRLRDATLDLVQREVIDVQVEMRFKRRRYRGAARKDCEIVRVIGIRDPSGKGYRFYVTNVAPEALAAEDVTAVYAARWEIELLFKQWKRHYRVEDLPSSKEHIVEALLYASLLTFVVSGRLAEEVRQRLGAKASRLRGQRWAAVFESVAQELLVIAVRPPRETKLIEQRVTSMLIREAVDPNAKRKGLIGSVEAREHRYRKAA